MSNTTSKYVFTSTPSIVITNDPIGRIVVLLVEQCDKKAWRYAGRITAGQADRLAHKIMTAIATEGGLFSINLKHWHK